MGGLNDPVSIKSRVHRRLWVSPETW